MKLAFYKASNGNVWDKIIAWWTRPSFINVFRPAKYSHVEMVFSTGECFSSSPRDGGTRWKVINVNDGKWDCIEIPNINEELIKALCYREENKGYDWLCIFFGFLIPLDFQNPSRWTCSELISKLMFNIERPHRVHPQMLYNLISIHYLI